MTGLLPDDPEEIRRIYRGLRTREALERVAFHEFDEGYLTLARVLDVALILGVPLLAPQIYMGLESYVRTISAYIVLALGTYGFYHVLGRNVLRYRFGRFHPYVARPERFWAMGPISLLFLILALPKRIAPESIDPTSLDVLEPVALEISAPLLARAREAVHDPLEIEADARISAIESRLAELARERDEEPDASWRAKIDRRTIALAVRLEEVRADAARLTESRSALMTQAAEVERGLDRLARHRRLLAEMREDEARETRQEALDDLRARLETLGESVAAIDHHAAARAGAEEELHGYLRPPH